MRTLPILAMLALAAPAAAEFVPMATAVPDSVPNGMNYQGRLEKDGFPVTGTRSMAFRLYNAVTGGTALYNSGTLAVDVRQGIFSVSLDIPFGSLTGTAQKYLELEVEGVVLSPRDALRSVPYAKVAETVEGNVEISTAGLTFTTNNIDSLSISSASGRVGIGTASPGSRLHVSSGTGEAGVILLVSTGASSLASVDGNGLMTSNGVKTGLITAGGTVTVQGNAFSVGSPDFVVTAGRVGLGTAGPLATLSVVGNASFSQPATFGSSVSVGGAADFGAGATKSTFAATGALAIPGAASLAVGSTFFVDGAAGRVGVGTASPSASAKLQVIGGDVLIGAPAVHDTSVKPDLLVEGNFILDGKFLQHTGAFSVFDQLGVGAEPQAGQTFAVGYTSFNVTNAGLVGIGTVSPGAKLTLVGDQSVSQSATFASSITVIGPNRLLGGFMDPATFNSSLTVVGANRLKGGYIEPATFNASVSVRGAADFGTTGVSGFTTAGALTIASGQDITLVGAGAELLGLPTTPSVNDAAASKAYVVSQTLAGSGWSAGAGKVELNVTSDKVGVGTASPGAKMTVVGDMSVTQPAIFASSVTVVDNNFSVGGTALKVTAGVVTMATALATGQGGTGNTNGTVAALTNNPTDCGANQYANAIAANGNLTCGSIADADVPDGITITLAGTATALAANPTDCGANQFANAIAASGNLTCAALADADVPDGITVTLAGTATALAANPTDCGANQYANAIAASGNLTCAAIADADVPDTITVNATAVAAGSLPTTVVAQTVQAAGATRLFSRSIVQLLAITPTAVGEIYYCNDCAPLKVVVSTATGLGNFAAIDGGNFQ
ncbi:hypothetical protein EPO15_14425 [bacterium]|nr:MAG: hypothetical protein EPO15_14425 [bacterium]